MASEVVADGDGEAHGDGKALVSLNHLGDLLAAVERLDNLLDVGDIDAIASGGGAIDADLNLFGSGDELHLGLGGTLDAGDDLFGAVTEGFELVQVVAEDFEGHVAAGAGDGLVHAHLHGLGELVGDAGDFGEGGFQSVGELLSIGGAGALLLLVKEM